MGLYDYIKCEYLLPDGYVSGNEHFQTKDTDFYSFYSLATYTLTANGRLLTDDGEDTAIHGSLTFYTSNVCGSCGAGVITYDDQPPYWREYVALFDEGQLIKIKGGKTIQDSPLMTRAAFNAWRCGA